MVGSFEERGVLRNELQPTPSGIASALADKQGVFVNVRTLRRKKPHRNPCCPVGYVKWLVIRAASWSPFSPVREVRASDTGLRGAGGWWRLVGFGSSEMDPCWSFPAFRSWFLVLVESSGNGN